MSDYRLTNDADAELLSVFLYGFETFGLAQAEAYRLSMARCFELLAANPRLGRKADELAPGTRRHAHARHVIYYGETSFGVLITAIVHERSMRVAGRPERARRAGERRGHLCCRRKGLGPAGHVRCRLIRLPC